MAVINKDFRVKNGLVVEGTTATVNGNDILTTTATLGDLSDVYLDTADNFGDVLTFTTSGWEAQAIPAVNSTDDVSEGSTNLYFTDDRAVSALENATDLSLNLSQIGTGISISSGQGGAGISVDGNALATEAFVNTAVAGLVDSAPGTLDTLNELAAALGDDPNFATTLTNQIAAKQDALTAGNGITITNNTVAVDTSVTDARADARIAAASIADLGDVSIEETPFDGNVLYYDANRGWMNNALTTENVSEHSSKLYFTDARAVSAIDAATEITPDSVKLNDQTTLTSFQSSGPVAANSTTDIFEFNPQQHLVAKIVLRVWDINTNDIHALEALVAIKYDGFVDSSDIYITEYADVSSSGDLFSLTVEMFLDDRAVVKVTNVSNSMTFIKGYIELV